MKNYLFIALFICSLFLSAGCTEEKSGDHNSTNNALDSADINQKPSVQSEKIIKGKIIKIENDMLLIADTEDKSGLYQISTKKFLGDISKITTGDIVEIGFDGTILEIYPSIIANVDYIIFLKNGEDFVGLYYDILMQLYETDLELNSGIDFIALDLTKDNNLLDSEKTALLHLLWSKTQKQTNLATYEELLSENFITVDENSNYAQFKTGILFKLETSELEQEKFTFNAEKWRSSLGAYFFTNCEARKENGTWVYEIGTEMIS